MISKSDCVTTAVLTNTFITVLITAHTDEWLNTHNHTRTAAEGLFGRYWAEIIPQALFHMSTESGFDKWCQYWSHGVFECVCQPNGSHTSCVLNAQPAAKCPIKTVHISSLTQSPALEHYTWCVLHDNQLRSDHIKHTWPHLLWWTVGRWQRFPPQCFWQHTRKRFRPAALWVAECVAPPPRRHQTLQSGPMRTQNEQRQSSAVRPELKHHVIHITHNTS